MTEQELDHKRLLDEAYGKAIDYLVAHKTPTDGGTVEKAARVLRDMAHHEDFQKAFAANMAEGK